MGSLKKALSGIIYRLHLFFKNNRIQRIIDFEERRRSEYRFKFLGENSYIPLNSSILNPQYISIGKNFHSLGNLRIEAIDRHQDQKFNPQIIIGNNVCFNSDVHIGIVGTMTIGDNVLMASRIFIADSFHGAINKEALLLPPINRSLFSKGDITIGENVWVGEGVCILTGVTIGRNAIIGANAVVTKDVPENAVVAGIPARIIKILN